MLRIAVALRLRQVAEPACRGLLGLGVTTPRAPPLWARRLVYTAATASASAWLTTYCEGSITAVPMEPTATPDVDGDSRHENDWAEHTDPTSGKSYFHNIKTGETAWKLPEPEANMAGPVATGGGMEMASPAMGTPEVASMPQPAVSAAPPRTVAMISVEAATAPEPAVSSPASQAVEASLRNAAAAAAGVVANMDQLDVNGDGKIDQEDIAAGAALAADLAKTKVVDSAGGITLGGVCGFASGYAVKKASKVALLGFGVIFMGLQGLAAAEFIQINWVNVAKAFDSQLDLNRDGKVDKTDLELAVMRLQGRLSAGMGPAAGGFAPGLAAGLRYG